MSKKIEKLEERIARIKRELEELGPMRPGTVSRQYRDPEHRRQPFYQLSYTHRMKSRSEYVRKENLAAIRRETAAFKRFRKLVDQWVDLALELSRLKTSLGLHSDQP